LNINFDAGSETTPWKSTAYSIDFVKNSREKTEDQELFFLTQTYYFSTRLVCSPLTFLLTLLRPLLLDHIRTQRF